MLKLQQIVEQGTAAILLRIALLAAALFPLDSVAYGQFTSGVRLVEVYATVTDPAGMPLTGLTAADFHVSEDGVPQPITTFAAGEFPLSVAIGLDRSFSMGGKGDRLGVAKSAARAFVSALRREDQVMVVAIGSETAIVAPLSSDRAAALDAIDRLDAFGTTPLYDAALLALDSIQSAKGRRALVLLSDGTDRYSDAKASDLVEQARRRDVLVYPVAIGSTRPPVFAELAAATGGRSFFAKQAGELNATLGAVARELRFQYLLGYVPPHAAQDHAEWHSIEVTVDRAGARVRARDGYYAR